MKNVIAIAALAAGLALLATGAACTKKDQPAPAAGGESGAVAQTGGQADAWYVCSMPDDNYWQKGPGRCPKCGMELVPAPTGWTPPAEPNGACSGDGCAPPPSGG